MPQIEDKNRNSNVIDKLLLDTNMLLAAVQFKADVFSPKAFTLSSCMDELKKLSKRKSKDGMSAKLILELLNKKKFPIIVADKKGDAAIIEYAVRTKCSVATNDKDLIERLKQRKVKVYRLRQKKMLVEA